MAEIDQDQKTEEPTGKRLQEAEEKGQLPISREIATWTMFVASLIVIVWMLPLACQQMTKGLRVFFEMPHALSLEGHGLQRLMFTTMSGVALVTAIIFAILAAAAIAGTMIQTGFYMNPVKLMPDFSRLNPMNGVKQLFSTRSLVELLKSFVKLVVLGWLAVKMMLPLLDLMPSYVGQNMVVVSEFLRDESRHMIIVLLLVITVIAVGDILYQRYQYFKGLRMTKQEVKDERKQLEGDPMIKGRLRQIRMEKARRRMMANVPKADVIVTNPTHYAVALQYDNSKMLAPVVLAKGIDRIAERIREVATEHNIPLVSNPPLARALYDTVELDHPIKTEHYRAVAEIISYVFKLKKKKINK